MRSAASLPAFFAGDQLCLRSSFLSSSAGDEERDGIHDFRARLRMVPVMDRDKRYSWASPVLLLSLSSARENLACERDMRFFAFLEARLNNSLFAFCTLSLIFSVRLCIDRTFSEKVRLI